MARRLAQPLTARQSAALDRYGYPYVHEDFRFHMTLSGSLADRESGQALAGLENLLGRQSLTPRARVRSLAVFRQDARDQNFRIAARCPFG